MGQVFGRGVKTPLHTRLLLASAVAAFAGSPFTAQAEPPSCKSITKGTLDVELPAGQRSSRMVRLAEGETVNFSIHSGASGATVTLVSGGSAPQTLLAANSGGMATYCAPATATYVFVIEAGRDSLTSVSANCTAAGRVSAANTDARPEMVLAQIETDTDTEGLSRRSAFSLGLSEFAEATKAAKSPINQWIGDGAILASAIDTADGDDDAAGAAALSFSANSEIGPDDLPGVLDRMQRLASAAASADAESQTAMTWAAILAPGLSFAPAAQPAAVAKRAVPRNTEVAVNDDAMPAIEGWWVTHLQDNRESQATTETAVTRRDMIASNTFPTPPMALGAFIPPAEPLQPEKTLAP